MFRVAGLCASIEIRSLAGGALTRWFQSSVKAPKHSNMAAPFCSQLSTGPWPGMFITMSDHQGSLRRCSNVKSNRVVIFFFNDTATTEIYTLSLHDALPI